MKSLKFILGLSLATILATSGANSISTIANAECIPDPSLWNLVTNPVGYAAIPGLCYESYSGMLRVDTRGLDGGISTPHYSGVGGPTGYDDLGLISLSVRTQFDSGIVKPPFTGLDLYQYLTWDATYDGGNFGATGSPLSPSGNQFLWPGVYNFVQLNAGWPIELFESVEMKVNFGPGTPHSILVCEKNCVREILMVGRGDFNGDGEYTTADIDALTAEIVSESIASIRTFDLNTDGRVTLVDQFHWLLLAAEINIGPSASYRNGDANLDGTVDGSDWEAWNEHRFSTIAAWSAGDFNADGLIDGSDFSIWNANKFTTANAIAVPEPGMTVVFLSMALSLCAVRRRRDGMATGRRWRGANLPRRRGLLLASGILCILHGMDSVAVAQPPVLTELRKFVASDASSQDHFGNSVGVSGDTILVGAFGARHNGVQSGAAYLFSAASGEEQLKLVANDSSLSKRFGISVAVSDQIAVVGASADDANGYMSGAAYTFDVATGQQLAKLLATDGVNSDDLGGSVAIDGNVAMAGAKFRSDTGVASGAAYLFDATGGAQLAKLTAANGGMFHQFGWSVGISGDRAVVGAPKQIGTGMSGSAYFFDSTNGSALFERTGCGSCGVAVAVSGNVAVVGAPRAGSQQGVALVIDATTGQQLFELRADDGMSGDAFGTSVAIDGNLAVVGSRYESGIETRYGAAYVFDVTTGQQLYKLVAADRYLTAEFGFTVAIDGNIAVVGSRFDDNGLGTSGAAYMYIVPEPPMPLSVLTLVTIVLSTSASIRRRKAIRSIPRAEIAESPAL